MTYFPRFPLRYNPNFTFIVMETTDIYVCPIEIEESAPQWVAREAPLSDPPATARSTDSYSKLTNGGKR